MGEPCEAEAVSILSQMQSPRPEQLDRIVRMLEDGWEIVTEAVVFPGRLGNQAVLYLRRSQLHPAFEACYVVVESTDNQPASAGLNKVAQRLRDGWEFIIPPFVFPNHTCSTAVHLFRRALP
jgi:hypothetical protein